MKSTARSSSAFRKLPQTPLVIESYIEALQQMYNASVAVEAKSATVNKDAARQPSEQRRLEKDRKLAQAFSGRQFEDYLDLCCRKKWAPCSTLVHYLINLPADRLRKLLHQVVQKRLSHDEGVSLARTQGLIRRSNTKAGRKPRLPDTPEEGRIFLRQYANSYCWFYAAYVDRFGAPRGPASGSLAQAYKSLAEALKTLDVLQLE